MNSLSWFLYFADITTAVQVVFGVVGAAAAFFGTIAWFIYKCSNKEHEKEDRDAAKSIAFKLIAIAFVAIPVCVLTPSKQTIYLIAASEAGERLSKTEAVSEISREAYDALRGYLKSITKELNATEKK